MITLTLAGVGSWSATVLRPGPATGRRGTPAGPPDRYEEEYLVGRKPWRKLWGDALLSSPKWQSLTMTQRGFWTECFLRAKDDGRLVLRPGVPLTTRDLAYGMGIKPSRVKGWQEALIKVGLAVVDGGYFTLSNMEEMQVVRGRLSDKRRTYVGQTSDKRHREMGNGKDLRQNSRADKEEEVEGTAGPTSSRAVPGEMTDAEYAEKCRANSSRRLEGE